MLIRPKTLISLYKLPKKVMPPTRCIKVLVSLIFRLVVSEFRFFGVLSGPHLSFKSHVKLFRVKFKSHERSHVDRRCYISASVIFI